MNMNFRKKEIENRKLRVAIDQRHNKKKKYLRIEGHVFSY